MPNVRALCALMLFITAPVGHASYIENTDMTETPLLKVFAGTDSRQPQGAEVFVSSLHRTHDQQSPVKVSQLYLYEEDLKKKGFLPEAWDKDQLSPFGRSRFLVPRLSNFEGWSLFVDGVDMLMHDDVAKLWDLRDDRYSVMVVKHPDMPQDFTILGRTHKPYPEFNWSSVMLFNNAKCRELSAKYIYKAPYLDLHQFKWVEPEVIGELPSRWNHLVGYYPHDDNAAIIHWTDGAPHLGGKHAEADYAELWFKEASLAGASAKH